MFAFTSVQTAEDWTHPLCQPILNAEIRKRRRPETEPLAGNTSYERTAIGKLKAATGPRFFQQRVLTPLIGPRRVEIGRAHV